MTCQHQWHQIVRHKPSVNSPRFLSDEASSISLSACHCYYVGWHLCHKGTLYGRHLCFWIRVSIHFMSLWTCSLSALQSWEYRLQSPAHRNIKFPWVKVTLFACSPSSCPVRYTCSQLNRPPVTWLWCSHPHWLNHLGPSLPLRVKIQANIGFRTLYRTLSFPSALQSGEGLLNWHLTVIIHFLVKLVLSWTLQTCSQLDYPLCLRLRQLLDVIVLADWTSTVLKLFLNMFSNSANTGYMILSLPFCLAVLGMNVSLARNVNCLPVSIGLHLVSKLF